MEGKQFIWVMYERSDIDSGNENEFQNYQSRSWAFTDFEVAKRAMRNRIVELAAGNNALFDELGEMPDLRRFIKIYADDPYFAEDKIKVQELHKTLHCILTDPNYPETKDDLNACLELFPVESVDSDFKGEGWQDGFSVGFGITD